MKTTPSTGNSLQVPVHTEPQLLPTFFVPPPLSISNEARAKQPRARQLNDLAPLV